MNKQEPIGQGAHPILKDICSFLWLTDRPLYVRSHSKGKYCQTSADTPSIFLQSLDEGDQYL